MALIPDLTSVHLEALTVIDRIERQLQRLQAANFDSDRTLRSLDHMNRQSVRLRRQLGDFFERERDELFPRVRRICGSEPEEISTLLATQHGVLESLDQFIADLDADNLDELAAPPTDTARLEQRFEEFVDRFDDRCELERSFYQSFSTILFPGGVATD